VLGFDEVSTIGHHKLLDVDRPVVTARERKSKPVESSRAKSSQSRLPEVSVRTGGEGDRRQPLEPVAVSPGVRNSYRSSQKFAKMALLEVNVDTTKRRDSSVYDLVGTTQSGDSSDESSRCLEADRGRQSVGSGTDVAKRLERNVKGLALSSETAPVQTVHTSREESSDKSRVPAGGRKAVTKESKRNAASAVKRSIPLDAFEDNIENVENLPSVEKLRDAVRRKGRRVTETRSKKERKLSTAAEKKRAAGLAPATAVATKSESLPDEGAVPVTETAHDHRDVKKPQKKSAKSSAPVVEKSSKLGRHSCSQDVEMDEKSTQQMDNRNAGQKRSSAAAEMLDSQKSKCKQTITRDKRATLSKLPDSTLNDVEPDSPVMSVRRRKISTTSDSGGKMICASDDASPPAPQPAASDGARRVKKSKKRKQQLTSRGRQKDRARAVSKRQKSTDG